MLLMMKFFFPLLCAVVSLSSQDALMIFEHSVHFVLMCKLYHWIHLVIRKTATCALRDQWCIMDLSGMALQHRRIYLKLWELCHFLGLYKLILNIFHTLCQAPNTYKFNWSWPFQMFAVSGSSVLWHAEASRHLVLLCLSPLHTTFQCILSPLC